MVLKSWLKRLDPHGEVWIQMGLPNGNATISLASFQGIICETENIEEEIKELKAKGIEVGKIDTTPWGMFTWVKDLDIPHYAFGWK